MKCRLCLTNLAAADDGFRLYDMLDNKTEASEMVKIIEKYLRIYVQRNDTVSTVICQECYDKLEQFNCFVQHVDEKQSILYNDYLKINQKQEADDWSNYREYSSIPTSEFKSEPLIIEEVPFNDTINYNNFKVENSSAKLIKSFEGNIGQIDHLEESLSDDVPLLTLKCRMKANGKKRKNLSIKEKETKIPEQINERETRRAKRHNVEILIATAMQLICDICETQFESWALLRDHFKLTHNQTPYVKCCDSTFHATSTLIQHINWHKNPNIYKCNTCGKKMRSQNGLTRHLGIAHGEDSALMHHFKCKKCSRIFHSQKLYEKHIKNHGERNDFPCHVCNKRYNNSNNLRRHIESIHENAYFHVCDVCGKQFKSKDSFERHCREHQGIIEPPLQCPLCLVWLKNRHSLRLHELNHSKKPTPCNICDKNFKTINSLRRHKAYWHGMERNLRCTFCDKIFRQERNLKEHIAIHTGDQLYSCPHCHKESRSKSNMYVHIKRQHPTEWLKSKMDRYNIKANQQESINDNAS
uniref:Transcription factor grauzone n=1 Tax=Glossina brevipalpis TaxID=37001 RepID=A0A1A9WWZ0_9MUSC